MITDAQISVRKGQIAAFEQCAYTAQVHATKRWFEP
jgi:hypothetical protein